MSSELQAVVLDPIEDRRWTALLDGSDASIFHHPLWMANLRDSYRYELWACCLQRADGTLAAGLPVATIRSRLTGDRMVSLPFADVCEPITGGDARLLEPLARAIEEERALRGLHLEIHGSLPALESTSPGDAFMHYTADLTDGIEAVSARMYRNKRKAARKAISQGVTVERRTDRDALDTFYGLHMRTRHKHGVPTQPRHFIRRYERLFRRGLGFVLIAKHEGLPIAAKVVLVFKGVMTWKYSASDERLLRLQGTTLMNVEAFRIGAEEGCHTVDLGRAANEDDGLRSYKEAMGAQGRPLTYTHVPAGSNIRSVRAVGNLQRTFIRRSPLAVGRLLGAAIYRHFG